MGYEHGRIQRFDDDIKSLKEVSTIMKDEAPDGSVVAISQTKDIGLSADLIDKMIYEYVECKVGISLIFSFDLPNGIATTLNLTDKTVEWETEYNPKNGDTIVKVSFLMTGDQRENQLSILRQNNIDGYILKLSEDGSDYIDYGELSSKGLLQFTIHRDQVKGWSLRSEECRVCVSKVDGEYEDAYIHGIMIELNGKSPEDNHHYILIGQCSPLPIFEEKDVLEAIPFPNDTSESVTVLTDDDLKCDPEPEGYRDWDGESSNPVFEKYRDKVRVLKNRADQWRCIFDMDDKSEFTEWSQEIADKAVNNRIQIHISDFFTWLLQHNKYDTFMERLNSDLNKLREKEAKMVIAKKLASYIKSEDTIRKLLETRDSMNRLVIVMMDIMDKLNIKHDDNGIMDSSQISKESQHQFMIAVEQLPEKIDCDRNIHELVVLIALESNLITDDQAKLPKEEVILLEGYKTIFDNISEIVKEFTASKMAK